MKHRFPRLAVRSIIVQDSRVLLVNAFPEKRGSDLWCAPGGGVEPGHSLPDNLKREIHEETGLTISVGALALVNEFHDPRSSFHQVDLFFRCQIVQGKINPNWQDPEGVVSARRFFSRDDISKIRLKPDSLPDVAFGPPGPAHYDALEKIVF